ncbi:hypothetical protein AQUCO_02000579v1 [Aquilegia coerulea]|uniref:BHLH domain-containing protein n=1 Tax=Aquilegia coerulea TaxID=218851 RepID=A0A2G5DI86_AQUCA|nr:hypothetical protein AQUCO_02000579v1 [Aquilegia coerulea]
MDEFVDHFFSSSSWPDVDGSERSSWVGSEFDQTNGLLPDTMVAYEGGDNNLPATIIPSHPITDTLLAQGTSMFAGGDPSFEHDKNLLSGEAQEQLLQGGIDRGSKTSLLGLMDGNLNPGYMDQQLNTPVTLGTLSYSSPELLPAAIDLAKSPTSVQPESGSVGSNDSEPSEIQTTLRDPHSLTPIPHLWPMSSYRAVSSLPSIMVPDQLQGLGLQGQYVETDAAVLGNNNFKDDNFLQGNLQALLNEQHELNNHYLSSFAARHQTPLELTAEHPQMQLTEGDSIKHYTDQSPISQLPHAPSTAVGSCNGAVKPRVRARRGQATDPHSIAERLRREKIAERMKNLQELVPNSNKTDKASMLDEIIEYVRFLQLQVKVLSMSRLGATGAVVPLITENQPEGSTSHFLSQSAGRDVKHIESPNTLTFEQEVVKLMESNMTKAMQFLQRKGLCLMPIALAAAISSSKAPPASLSTEGKKSILTNGFVHHNSGQPNIGPGQISSDGETRSEENIIGIHSREDFSSNSCSGTSIKKEGTNTTNFTREMNQE